MITDFKHAMEKSEKDFRNNQNTWILVSMDIADQMLNAVPPIYTNTGFACGEPYSEREGKTVYHCFRKHSGEAMTMRICSIDEANTLSN
jgi:hypothetical protein